MSKARPRTGLNKPREIERAVNDARWREAGAAEGQNRNPQAQIQGRMSLAWLGFCKRLGADPSNAVLAGTMEFSLPDGVQVAGLQLNQFAEWLLNASRASGEDEDTGEFRLALEKLRKLGWHGANGIRKIEAELGPSDEDRGLTTFVDQFDGSQEQAMESAAVAFVVPAASFEAAVKRLKRRHMRVRRPSSVASS